MQIVAESPDFYRSSEVQLGDKARTSLISSASRPAPTTSVMLLGSGGQQLTFARQQVNVIATGAGH
jgi:hypothetical protein